MIGLLVTILLLVLIFGMIWWVLRTIPLPAPFGMVAQVVVAILFIVVLLGMLFGGIDIPVIHTR